MKTRTITIIILSICGFNIIGNILTKNITAVFGWTSAIFTYFFVIDTLRIGLKTIKKE